MALSSGCGRQLRRGVAVVGALGSDATPHANDTHLEAARRVAMLANH